MSPSKTPLPLYALPTASTGWIRATPEDAEQGALVKSPTLNWPRIPKGASLPIEQNTGFKQLGAFACMYRSPDMEMRAKSKSQAWAIDIAASGEYLNVAIEYPGEKNALGAPNAPAE